MAKAKAQSQSAVAAAQASIMKAAKTCKAQGLRGERVCACVSSRDGLKATPADPPGRRR